MSIQQFICYPCNIWWEDKYSFWRGYQSLCPGCGKSCAAIRDILEYGDQRLDGYNRFSIDGPLFECEEDSTDKTLADLEAEREQIHDEIAEALDSLAPEMSDIDVDVEGAGVDAGDAGDSVGSDS